jgi:radical SAM protein with 4Fe4S-binding SPASM domain
MAEGGSVPVLSKLVQAGRAFYHWRLRRSTRLPYQPIEISLELTNRCNFKCAFCPQSDPAHFARVPPTSINPEQANEILRKLRAGGIRGTVIHWTLDGEPFMNKRFHEVLAAAGAWGFHTHHLATNGYFMSPERLRQLPSQGHRYVLTPDFCSDEAYFEEHRGTPGSWKVVLENIRGCLADAALAHLHFEVTDISSYRIRDPDELRRRFEALRALFPRSDRISFHQRTFHNATGHLPIAEDKLGRGEYHLCPYPWFSFTIASNGDVVACCRDLEHKTVLGNLLEQELDAVWNGERYQALRRDLLGRQPERQAACRNCDMPYDAAKFSLGNLTKTALHRLLLLDRPR